MIATVQLCSVAVSLGREGSRVARCSVAAARRTFASGASAATRCGVDATTMVIDEAASRLMDGAVLLDDPDGDPACSVHLATCNSSDAVRWALGDEP